MKALEGQAKSVTKGATRFKSGKLKGLWHSHFFDATHMYQNLEKIASNEKTLERIAKKIASESQSEEEFISKLAHRLSIVQYQNDFRSGQLTGDWIIFGKYKEENYYLSIVVHPKESEDTDEIFENIVKQCKGEFPFLF